LLDNHLGLGSAPEPFDAQALVAELAIEALCHAILPRLARLDQRRGYALRRDPREQRTRHKLGSIVRPQIMWRSAFTHQSREHLDHASRSDASCDVDGKALLRKFVRHRQTLYLPTIRTSIEDKIVAPDLIGKARRQRSRPRVRNPLPRP